ncbi:hypothetical protein [Oricola sp.]|uniref:hypothetical protein n=1 Tax=Oricola sp. TaxID=1979950 RepID=UPI0025E15729|nr:hypothetical protein [Oricola sp.]MCI5077588.1 hypothetical protein [Oricola sp.]
MTTYTAIVVDGDTGGEGRYNFEYDGDLLKHSPATVLRTFWESVDRNVLLTEHVDYELNAAMKNATGTVVTALGAMLREHDGAVPFMAMISKKRA